MGVAFIAFVVVSRLLEEPPKAEDNPRLDGVLNAIVAVYAESGPEAALALAPLALPEAEAIAVVFYTQGGASTAGLAQSLRDLGIDPQIVGEDYIESYVPLPLLALASDLDSVEYMEAIIPARPAQGSAPAASLSPALPAHGVLAWQASGYTGQGVKVGIIDAGFDYYSQAMQAGEVPAPAAVRCYIQLLETGERHLYLSTLEDCGGHWHGTAVAEALLDIAPEVTVYLARTKRPGETRLAVEWLVAQDVDIINFSMASRWDGPGDGTSPKSNSPLRTVDYAVQHGITWVNSAGNENQNTWYGDFNPSRSVFDRFQKTPRYWHSFTGTARHWRRKARCGFVELEQGDLLEIQLRWEDNGWRMAERDLDILVFDPQHQEFAQADTGKKVQKGRPQDVPYEFFHAEAPVTGTYCISIRYAKNPQNLNIPDPGWIQLHVWSGEKLAPFSDAGSIDNPAESQNSGLLAVGATDHATNQTIEEFSSRGPTPDGHAKPDIVGVDGTESKAKEWGTQNTQYPSEFFYGTSQAAPHVAGLAALVIQRFGGSDLFDTPAEVAQYLRSNAAPRPGVPNTIWGQGLALLPAPAVSQACPPNGPSPDLACDKENLLAAKAELIGTATGALSTWQPSTDIADFERVAVAGAPPRVVQIDLEELSLAGQIPARLGNLAQLWELSLHNNSLTGSIPPELGNLTNLTWLALSNNPLTGSIPPELGNLASLEGLWLWQNQLTGSIPPALGNLANLEELTLHNNQLTGSIPPELGNLAKLKALHLYENQLTGSIPPALGSLAQLEWVDLADNQLTGPIPPALGNLASLEGLGLWQNQLTGSIPPQLGNLTSLGFLDLSGNQLTGSIPPALGNLANLFILDLGGNQLTGSIPPALGNLANLFILDLGGNQLTGSIPPALGNLAQLERLRLRDNQLTGPIPPALGNLANFLQIYLPSDITGCIAIRLDPSACSHCCE